MPSQATPLSIVPAAPPATPARGASAERAADGFDALVQDARANRDGGDQTDNPKAEAVPDADERLTAGGTAVPNDAATDADVFVAELPVETAARPATGSVLDAVTGPATEPDTPDGAAINTEAPELAPAGANSGPATDLMPATGTDPQVALQPTGDRAPANPALGASATPEPATQAVAPAEDAEIDLNRVNLEQSATEAETLTSEALAARDTRVADVSPRPAEPQAPARPQPAPPVRAEGHSAVAQSEISAPDAAPQDAELSAQAQTVTSDGEPVEAEILAPLREGRPASERAPGELIRGDARAARDGADPSAVKADAKSGAAEAKSAGADVKPAPQAVAQVQQAQASPAPNPTAPPAPLVLLLAQVGPAQLTDAPVGDVFIDPTLSKTDAIFDPAAARAEARTEIRTASTLQFAQGPRLTPQSAQSMAAQIAQRFNEGSRVFDIRMDPPELGRVEVRLEVGKDNSVRAVLAAERTETLAELQRSARDLERALTEAGLDVGEDALSFSLTDENAFSDDARGETGPDTPVFMNSDADVDALSAPIGPISTYGFLLTRAEGLDVSV